MPAKSHWSDSERNALQAHYPAISSKKLSELLQDRSARAISHQAAKLGVKKCQERLREMGRENNRWAPKGPFKTPDSPPQ